VWASSACVSLERRSRGTRRLVRASRIKMAGPAATVAEQICAAGYKTGLGRLPFRI